MKTSVAVLTLVGLFLAGNANAAVVITQYYEGVGSNKFIELKNIGNTSFDLGTLRIGRWTNDNREGYKANVAPSASTALVGSLAAEGIYLISATATPTAPAYISSSDIDLVSGALNVNGDDSIAVYTVDGGTLFATANLIDAIGFTSATQGLDTGFVRTSVETGFNLVAGSSVDTFPDVWDEVSILNTNDAPVGSDLRLGISAVAVPEPSSLLILVSTGLAAAGRRRFVRLVR